MGMFRVLVQAVGDHGCERDKKDSEVVEGCGKPGCVDCITRRYVSELKVSGCTFDSWEGAPDDQKGIASITHWPGQPSAVEDNLLTGVRSGSF